DGEGQGCAEAGGEAAVTAGGIGARAASAAGAAVSRLAGISPVEESFLRLLMRAYPAELRGEHSSEMEEMSARMCARAAADGAAARAGVWLRLLRDTLRSAPAEHWREHRERMQTRKLDEAARGVPAPDVA